MEKMEKLERTINGLKLESEDVGKQLLWQALEIERLNIINEDLRAAHMTEEKARDVLGNAVNHEGGYIVGRAPSIFFSPDSRHATLEDAFTTDQLEAISWWMRNKGVQG